MNSFQTIILSTDITRALNIGLSSYISSLEKGAQGNDMQAIEESLLSFIHELPPQLLETIGDKGIAVLLWIAIIRARIDVQVKE